MASILAEKANEDFLAEQLGYDRDFVGLVGSRLRAAGAWTNKQFDQGFITKLETHKVTLNLFSAIAGGDVMVVGGSKEESIFELTPKGRRRIEARRREAGN